MLANRYSKIFAGLLILVVASVSVDFAIRPKNFAATNNSLNRESGNVLAVSNTYLPLPPGKQTQLVNAVRGTDDFYQRHPNWNWSASASAASYPDYYHRHPELSKSAILGLGASDYAARHPELSAPAAAASIDLTDYYFRHLDS